MSDRGSGRTSRQLAALPDDGVFLVANAAIAQHCRHLLHDAGRWPDAVRVVTLATRGAANRLRGTRRGTAWDIDHAFGEVAGPIGREEAAIARVILSR